MSKYCFYLQVLPEKIDEYIQRHKRVWPEMLEALKESGWRNYSLFMRSDGLLVGYVEADDLDAAQKAMSVLEINRKWQSEMAQYFEKPAGRLPDESFQLLTHVFDLDDQLEQGQELELDDA